MVRTNLLKAKMAEREMTTNDLAEAMGVKRVTASAKLRGDIGFSVGDVTAIISLLGLTSDEVGDIFFAGEGE